MSKDKEKLRYAGVIHTDRELDIMLLNILETNLASLKRNGPNYLLDFWDYLLNNGEWCKKIHQQDIERLEGKIREVKRRLQ